MEPLQPGLSENSFRSWWSAEGNSKLQRIALLKAIEAATAAVYEREVLSLEPDARKRSQVRAVVLESNLAGLDEFGPEWYECIRAKMQRMTLCAEWIVLALDAGAAASGFDAFERALVAGAARMLPAYNRYYLDFLAAVRDEAVIAALQAHRPPPDAAAIHSHYTVVRCGAAGLSAVPFATHFAPALADVLARFDEWIAACRAADAACGDQSAPWDAEARATYVAFLQQYRDALALNAEAPALEAAWTELDRRWMDTKMPIQIVHDIETGYGDPLRVKATPDMSLRFLDESFAEANATIADIQRRMEAFYRRRDTPLARDGLQALSNTMAGIYFIPFKTGISLQFSFSGQSIPNRVDVKKEKGVKIYFDPVETAARVELNKPVVKQVYHDAENPATGPLAVFKPDAVEQLVWHVAAHEVGHAIYNLASVQDCFSQPGNVSLLEEPRAELTALFTLKLLFEQDVLTRPQLDKAVAHFALDALRYFAKYDSEALYPYIIFMVYFYKVHHKHGYLTLHPDSGKLVLDPSKTLLVLDEFAGTFERLLGLMDARDGAGLEALLFQDMAPEDDFVRAVVALVRAKGG